MCVKHEVKISCFCQCYVLSYCTSEHNQLPSAQNVALSMHTWLPVRHRWKDAQKSNPKKTQVKTAGGLLASVKTMALCMCSNGGFRSSVSLAAKNQMPVDAEMPQVRGLWVIIVELGAWTVPTVQFFSLGHYRNEPYRLCSFALNKNSQIVMPCWYSLTYLLPFAQYLVRLRR